LAADFAGLALAANPVSIVSVAWVACIHVTQPSVGTSKWESDDESAGGASGQDFDIGAGAGKQSRKENMRINPKAVLGVLILAGVAWFGYAGWRAQHKLVTLNVQGAEVREVLRSIQWQVWEPVYIHKAVSGKVTLQVQSAPLEDVLAAIGEQTSSRCASIYPLYSTAQSLQDLRKVLTGEYADANQSWTNLQNGIDYASNLRAHDSLHEQRPLVSLQLEDQDLSAAARAISRFAPGQIVPEDGPPAKVSLNLTHASLRQALTQLARQIHRHWTHLYALQVGPGHSPRPGDARKPGEKLAESAAQTNRP
jgi:type II secretory pathway component GspD/PulD (secretin)